MKADSQAAQRAAMMIVEIAAWMVKMMVASQSMVAIKAGNQAAQRAAMMVVEMAAKIISLAEQGLLAHRQGQIPHQDIAIEMTSIQDNIPTDYLGS